MHATWPIRVILSLADQCNYRCRTCYQSFHQSFAQFDLSSTDIGQVSRLFRYALSVIAGGFGEPLLSPAATSVLAAAKAAGCFTSITTNGSLLQRLAGVPVDRIDLSFDGASAKVLETIRSGANLSQIVRNVLALSEAQRARMSLNVVVNKLNVAEVSEIVALARRLGIGEVALQALGAYLPWHDDMRLTAADLTVLDEQVAEARAQAGSVVVRDLVLRDADPRATSAPSAQVLEALDDLPDPKPPERAGEREMIDELRTVFGDVDAHGAAFFSALAEAREPITSHFADRNAKASDAPAVPYCMEPFSTIVVLSDGTVNPCCKLSWNMGNINDAPIESIWSGVSYRTLRTALISRNDMPALCRTCRDHNRWANAPELLGAMAAQGAPAPVTLPDDWDLPPSIAESPHMQALSGGVFL